MFRFRLYLPDGNEVGVFETLVPNWQPAEAIVTDDGRGWFASEGSPRRSPRCRLTGDLEVEPLGQLTAARHS